jgi:hypothetical protein
VKTTITIQDGNLFMSGDVIDILPRRGGWFRRLVSWILRKTRQRWLLYKLLGDRQYSITSVEGNSLTVR